MWDNSKLLCIDEKSLKKKTKMKFISGKIHQNPSKTLTLHNSSSYSVSRRQPSNPESASAAAHLRVVWNFGGGVTSPSTKLAATSSYPAYKVSCSIFMWLFRFIDKAPVVHKNAFVARSASITGQVYVGPSSSIWYWCVVRGVLHWINYSFLCVLVEFYRYRWFSIYICSYISVSRNYVWWSAVKLFCSIKEL